jgi:hypothetical protein
LASCDSAAECVPDYEICCNGKCRARFDPMTCGGCANQCAAGEWCILLETCTPDDPLCNCCKPAGLTCAHTEECCTVNLPPGFALQCNPTDQICDYCYPLDEFCDAEVAPCCDGPNGEERRCSVVTSRCFDVESERRELHKNDAHRSQPRQSHQRGRKSGRHHERPRRG